MWVCRAYKKVGQLSSQSFYHVSTRWEFLNLIAQPSYISARNVFFFFFFIILVNKDHQFLNKKQTKEFTFLLNWLMCSSHDSECVLEDVNFGTLAAAFLFIGRGSSFSRWSAAEVNTVYPRCSRVTACHAHAVSKPLEHYQHQRKRAV